MVIKKSRETRFSSPGRDRSVTGDVKNHMDKKTPITDWFKAVGKILPGDHIHYEASTREDLTAKEAVLIRAEEKRRRKMAKRIGRKP